MPRPTWPRRRHLLVLGAALALLAGACADPADETDPTDETDETDPTDEAAEPAPDEPREVTLLTHDSFDVSADVLDAFTDATGIEVAIVPLGDAGSALNQAILTRDAPQGDLLFGVDTSFLSRALDQELFEAYDSPALDDVDERFLLDPELRAIPITYGDVCLNHDVGWFEDRDLAVPSDLEDLTDPDYEGLLAVQNPATSSPGLSFLLATIERFGEDGYLDFWEDLVANDVVVTDGWSEAYYDEFSGTGGGDRPLVVSYASSPPAEVFFADPQPDEAPTGVIEASCFRQVEFVGILDGTERRAEAEELVDFMLSTTFQEDLPLTMFVFPVNDRAELPEVFVEHAVIPSDPLELDPMVIGEQREAWIEAWTATVLR
ncbi:MAG: thiamine ABC transporter substrate-binding protein [Nitriliruptor sp.]|nr:MAG: thiamine ABC transporter substrate-binding protein [Nitriliruptor sp.]